MTLEFRLPGSPEPKTITDLKSLGDSVDLLKELKGAKMSIKWPRKAPESDPELKYKIARERMHPRKLNNQNELSGGAYMRQLSDIWVILITVPAVSFALYMICKWLKFPPQKSKMIALIGSLISLFVEILLIIIQTHKKEKAVLSHRHDN